MDYNFAFVSFIKRWFGKLVFVLFLLGMIVLGCLNYLHQQNEKKEFQKTMEPILEQKKIWEEYQLDLPKIMEQVRLGDRKDAIVRLENWVTMLRKCEFIRINPFPLEGEMVLGILYEEDEQSVTSSQKSQELYEYLHSKYPDYPFAINEIQFNEDGSWNIRISREKFLRKKSQYSTPMEN